MENPKHKFTKYQERGAYHWQNAYGRSVIKRHPKIHSWYDVPLNIVNKHLRSRIAPPFSGIDIGCGDGVLLYKAKQRGFRLLGADLAFDGLGIAKEELIRRGYQNPKLLCADSFFLPLADETLDFVISIEVIEHVDNVENYLREIERVLKPHGIFVCTTPQRFNSDFNHVRDPFHLHEYTPSELNQLLLGHFRNSRVEGIQPAYLDRVYDSATGMRVVDGVFRVLFRLTSLLFNGYNFLRCSDPAERKCQTLIGIGWSD